MGHASVLVCSEAKAGHAWHRDAPDAEALEVSKAQLKAATQQLQDEVIGSEVALAEDLLAMAHKYDRDITALAEACHPHYGTFFVNVRPIGSTLVNHVGGWRLKRDMM